MKNNNIESLPKIRIEVTGSDKHSSLLQYWINYEPRSLCCKTVKGHNFCHIVINSKHCLLALPEILAKGGSDNEKTSSLLGYIINYGS